MEEKASLSEVILEFIKKNILIVILIGVGCLLSLVGIYQYFASKSSTSDLQFTSGADSQSSTEPSGILIKEITVDVAGEVKKPGVYTLPAGSRITNALEAAGGLTTKADKEYVAKRLNLAQKAIDGGKIYIPAAGESPQIAAPAASNGNTDSSVMGASEVSTGLIDINNAPEQSLDTLPKVGPVTAQKIITNRPYTSIEELVSKKVMTQKTFDGLKDRITVQ